MLIRHAHVAAHHAGDGAFRFDRTTLRTQEELVVLPRDTHLDDRGNRIRSRSQVGMIGHLQQAGDEADAVRHVGRQDVGLLDDVVDLDHVERRVEAELRRQIDDDAFTDDDDRRLAGSDRFDQLTSVLNHRLRVVPRLFERDGHALDRTTSGRIHTKNVRHDQNGKPLHADPPETAW